VPGVAIPSAYFQVSFGCNGCNIARFDRFPVSKPEAEPNAFRDCLAEFCFLFLILIRRKQRSSDGVKHLYGRGASTSSRTHLSCDSRWQS
jgi:hypothetical protein